MVDKINNTRKMVVKKAIKEKAANTDKELRPGTEAYSDLMQNVEFQVQAVLEECGEIEQW